MTETSPGVYQTTPVDLMTDCTGWLIQPSAEVQSLVSINDSINNLIEANNYLFQFDATLFAIIFTANLLAFATGHILGRVLYVMRKTF